MNYPDHKLKQELLLLAREKINVTQIAEDLHEVIDQAITQWHADETIWRAADRLIQEDVQDPFLIIHDGLTLILLGEYDDEIRLRINVEEVIAKEAHLAEQEHLRALLDQLKNAAAIVEAELESRCRG